MWSSSTDTDGTESLQQFRSLPNSMARNHRRFVSVQVHGEAFPSYCSMVDMYRPRHRLYSSSEQNNLTEEEQKQEPSVKHLDIITTWKGLSISQAKELLFWETSFKGCLESYIEQELITQFYSSSDNIKSLSETAAVSYMYDFVSQLGLERWSINLNCLIDSMLEEFLRSGQQCSWFASSGSLRTSITNFISSKDCFWETHLFPLSTFDIDFTVNYNGRQSLLIKCGIGWVPPRVTIDNFKSPVIEGQDIFLFPKYCPKLRPKYYDIFRTASEHSVESADVSLAWDEALQGFRGIAPRFSNQLPGTSGTINYPCRVTCQFDIGSTITQSYPCMVTLQRAIRTQACVIIVPKQPSWARHDDPGKHVILNLGKSVNLTTKKDLELGNLSSPIAATVLHTPRSVPMAGSRRSEELLPLTALPIRTRPRCSAPAVPFHLPSIKRSGSPFSDKENNQSVQPERCRNWANSQPNADSGDDHRHLKQSRKFSTESTSQSILGDIPNGSEQQNSKRQRLITRRRSHTRDSTTNTSGIFPPQNPQHEILQAPLKSQPIIYSKNLPAWREMSGFDEDLEKPVVCTDAGSISSFGRPIAPNDIFRKPMPSNMSVTNLKSASASATCGSAQSKIALPSPLDEVGMGKRFPPLRDILAEYQLYFESPSAERRKCLNSTSRLVEECPSNTALASSVTCGSRLSSHESSTAFSDPVSDMLNHPKTNEDSSSQTDATAIAEDCSDECDATKPNGRLRPTEQLARIATIRRKISDAQSDLSTDFSSTFGSTLTRIRGGCDVDKPSDYRSLLNENCNPPILLSPSHCRLSAPPSSPTGGSDLLSVSRAIDKGRLLSSFSFELNDESGFTACPLTRTRHAANNDSEVQDNQTRIDTPTVGLGNRLPIAFDSNAGETLNWLSPSSDLWEMVSSVAGGSECEEQFTPDQNTLKGYKRNSDNMDFTSPYDKKSPSESIDFSDATLDETTKDSGLRYVRCFSLMQRDLNKSEFSQSHTQELQHPTPRGGPSKASQKKVKSADEQMKEMQQYYSSQLAEKRQVSSTPKMIRQASDQNYEAGFWDTDNSDMSF